MPKLAWEPIDKSAFIKAYLSGQTNDELALNFNSTSDTVEHYLRRLRSNGEITQRGAIPLATSEVDSISDLDLKVLKKLKLSSTAISITTLANDFDVSPKRIEEAVIKLEKQNYLVTSNNGAIQFSTPSIGGKSTHFNNYINGTKLRFGVISDEHLCSKFARLDILNTIFDIFEDQGVTNVYNCGNFIDGEASFNKQDLIVHGFGNQIKYFIDNYPKRDNITTHFIVGDDHEGWYHQREGIDVGKYLQNEAIDSGRNDIKYLSYMEHDVYMGEEDGPKTRIRFKHPGGGCFDDTAEILTKDRGWISFKDLTYEDYVATMDKVGHKFEWQKPTHITKDQYSGDLLHFKNRVFDFRVTPNHRLWVRRYNTYRSSLKTKDYPTKARHHFTSDWYAITAEELCNTYHPQRFSIPTVCSNWEGELIPEIIIPRLDPMNINNKRNSDQMQHLGTQPIEKIAELIAWYVTEGSTTKKSVSICQDSVVNPDNHKRITDLLKSLGLRVTVSGRNNKNISVGCKELAVWLKDTCGSGSRNKYLPAWLKNQPKYILDIVLKTMIKGDGSENGSSYVYSSISKRLRHDISEIAQKCGYGIVESTSRGAVNIRSIQNNPTVNIKPTKENYTGVIYCCTVPNELIYVRSKNKAFWSHNSAYALSYQPQKEVESFMGGDKPLAMFLGHFHKFGYFFVRNVHVAMCGCVENQTTFMRKKRLAAHLGAMIVDITQGPDGSILEFIPRFLPFYDIDNESWKYEVLSSNEDMWVANVD